MINYRNATNLIQGWRKCMVTAYMFYDHIY